MPGDHGEIPMDFSPYDDDIMDVYTYIYIYIIEKSNL